MVTLAQRFSRTHALFSAPFVQAPVCFAGAYSTHVLSHVVAARGPYTFLWGVWARQRPGVGAFMCVTAAYPRSSSTLSTFRCRCCHRVVVLSWSFMSPMRGVFEDYGVYAVERAVCYVLRVVLTSTSTSLSCECLLYLSCLPPESMRDVRV